MIQTIQDKAQSVENGEPFSRAATLDWIVWITPYGRAGKRSSALLRLLVRTRHCLRDAPSDQTLPGSLNTSILFGQSTSYRIYFGEDGNTVVILLCGGDKSTQKQDIETAKSYWKEYKDHG